MINLLPFLLAAAVTLDPALGPNLGWDGMGSTRIGLPFDQVQQLWPDELLPPAEGLKASAHCYHVSPERHRQITLMFYDERLARIDLTGAPGQSRDGIRIGDGIGAIKAHYPDVVITGQADQQVTATSADKKSAIRFYLLNGVVTAISAGDAVAVALDEGCY